jgi:hypothetical protein
VTFPDKKTTLNEKENIEKTKEYQVKKIDDKLFCHQFLFENYSVFVRSE